MLALVAASSASAGPVRATATTGAPASANAPAIPRPKPRLAPTTTVVRPDKSLMIVLFPSAEYIRSCRRCRHHDVEKMGAPLRPVRGSAGVDTGDMTRGWSDASRLDHQGAGRGRRRVPRTDRAVPSRAPGALLPDAGVLPGRRGRPTGHAAGRLAGPRRVRGTGLDPHLALPDRHQPVPQRASLDQTTPGQGVGHP